jgi:hypothetical protein
MPTTTRKSRLRSGEKAAGRVNKKNAAAAVAARPVARQRTQQANLALDAFTDLRCFFAHDVNLAQALGWDEATTAQWRDRIVVRPQRLKAMQVVQLAELAREARAYLENDTSVGEWLNAPLPNLRGNSPALWLRSRGPIGLRELTHGMVDWMPRPPDRDLEPIDAEQARAYLDEASEHDEGAAELRRMLADLD